MFKKLRDKIQSNIVLNTVLTVTVPIVFFTIIYLTYVYFDLRRDFTNQYKNELALLSHKAANQLSIKIKNVTKVIHQASYEALVKNSLSPDTLDDIVMDILTKEEYIYGSGIFFRDYQYNPKVKHAYIYKYKKGNNIIQISNLDGKGKYFDFTIMDWWQNSIHLMIGRWSKPYFDTLGRTYMVTYSCPFVINNEVLGVITADIDIKSLASIAERGNTSHFDLVGEKNLLIISKDSSIIYSYNKEILGRKVFDVLKERPEYADLEQVLKNVFNKDAGISTYKLNGEEYFIFFAEMQVADWISISQVKADNIKKMVFRTVMERTIMAIGIIIALILIIIMLARRFVKPIQYLSEVSLKIANGDYDIPITINRKDEVGVLAKSFDIMKTKLKEREEELKNATQNFINLLDNLPFAVMQYDKNFHPLYMNKFTINLLEQSHQEYKVILRQKKSWLEVINEKYRDEVLRVLDGEMVVIKGDDIMVHTDWFTSPYEGKFIEIYFIPIFDGNEVESTITIIFDMTEERKNEELRIEITASERTAKAKSEFLARMSHEIRTPLNAIIGFTDLAIKKYNDPNDQIYKYLVKIKHSSTHLLGIINDILDYSKIEAGKIELESTDFDIETILVDLFDLATSIAHKKNLEFIISHSPLIPSPIYGDPHKLKQILFNLVSNAIKFTSEGEVHVNVDIKEQTKEKIKLLFKVRDTGIGLSESEIKNLFQPFVQADGSITRQYGGTGIGLTISKKLVEMMNGEIWVESKKGEGSTFYFTAEFKVDKNSKNFLEFFKKYKFSSDIRNLKVLICDDNRTTLHIIKNILSDFGYSVDAVESGKEVIRLLEQQNHYDLLIIDKVMPEPDGLQTMQIIIEKGLKHFIKKVILLSAYDVEEDVDKFDNLGIDDFHSKPVSYSNIFDKIIKVFNQNKSVQLEDNREKKSDSFFDIPVKTANITVLVVDDNELNREVMIDLLDMLNIKVETANNGKEAVEKVKNSGVPSRYSMIFMDIQMPEMNGFEATRTIRKMDAYKNLPIVAMTADVMPGIKEACLKAGMNDYLTKPINPEEVGLSITKWIKSIKIVKKVSKKKKQKINGLKSINLDEALARIGGKEDKFLNLLCKFYDNYKNFSEDFSNLKTQDEKQIFVHTFKAVSGNIAAKDLYKAVVELEKKVINQEDYLNELNLVTTLLHKVLEEIKEYCKKKKKQKKKSDEMNENMLTDILQVIISRLKNSDPEIHEELKKIEPFLKDNPDFKEAVQRIESYNFDEAVVFLEKLLNRKKS